MSSAVDFSKYAVAPSSSVRSARPSAANPLYITTRVSGEAVRIRGSASSPSMPGIETSRSISVGRSRRASSTASWPFEPSPTTSKTPDSRSRVRTSVRTSTASSTTTIVGRSVIEGAREVGEPPAAVGRASAGGRSNRMSSNPPAGPSRRHPRRFAVPRSSVDHALPPMRALRLRETASRRGSSAVNRPASGGSHVGDLREERTGWSRPRPGPVELDPAGSAGPMVTEPAGGRAPAPGVALLDVDGLGP